MAKVWHGYSLANFMNSPILPNFLLIQSLTFSYVLDKFTKCYAAKFITMQFWYNKNDYSDSL